MKVMIYRLLMYLVLALCLSCSTTNIDLTKSDIDWVYKFDFYAEYRDGLLIENDYLILTHYTMEYDFDNLNHTYFENIFRFDRESGNLVEYKFIDDSLTSRDITWSEKFHKFANRTIWPKAFNMKSAYEINIDIDHTGPIHFEKRFYDLEIKKDDKEYSISLDELGEIRIEYYLTYSNELYLWVESSKLRTPMNSSIYKLNIDKIIKNHE